MIARAFCATCLAYDAELEPELVTDRPTPVLLCRACREGHPRSGRWAFAGGREYGADARTGLGHCEGLAAGAQGESLTGGGGRPTR